MKSDFEHLSNPTFRQRFEKANNFFVAEGFKIVQRAMALGYQPRTLVGTPQWLAPLEPILGDFIVHELSAAEISKIAGYEVHRGVLATFERKPVAELADVLAIQAPLLLAENLVDLENLGSIFRTVSALGLGGVLLSPECPDPYYRRCIKASMGASLQVPFAYYDDASFLNRPIIGFTPSAKQSVTEIHAGGNEILAFGSEGAGLSAKLLSISSQQVAIPMHNQVDSLNVAASAAVGIWEYLQRVTALR